MTTRSPSPGLKPSPRGLKPALYVLRLKPALYVLRLKPALYVLRLKPALCVLLGLSVAAR
jgi:hypothetical protein